MQSKRWWHVAIVGSAALQLAILLLSDPTPWQLVIAGVASVIFVAAWFTIGYRCADGSPGTVAFVVIVVVFAGVVTWANPTLAIVQCIAFPLAWTRLERIGASVAANFAIAIAVGTGLLFATGSYFQAVVIEALSLAFSLGLGLWISSIASQSEARQRLLDELQAAQAQLAALSRDAGVTSERDRLAREIHDTIAQDLTGIVLVAQRASRELVTGADVAGSLALLEENARAALAETRALVASTASPGLEAGLAAALDRLAARFQRETGIEVAIELAADGAATDRATEVVLLRVAQEGLSNVRKHSGATSVTITLNERSLAVRDNGRGFDTTADSTGFGLAGMRDRLALVGGSLEIASGADGTTVRVTT